MSNNINTVIKHKLSILNLAQELSNISKACKRMGVSRDTFYCYEKAYEQGSVEALIDSNRRVPNLKNRVEPAVESAVKAYAIEQPTHAQHRASNELRKRWHIYFWKWCSFCVASS